MVTRSSDSPTSARNELAAAVRSASACSSARSNATPICSATPSSNGLRSSLTQRRSAEAAKIAPTTAPLDGAQRKCRERLDTQAAPLLLQGGVARVVLVSRPDRDEAPRPHRVRHHPAELERVHGEAVPCLLRHVGRGEGLEARRVADPPHEDDVRPELLELRDGRGRDLLDRRRGREPRGVPLHELRLPAGVALALEESRALERAAELLADGVQHPPLRFGQLAVIPESDADRTDRARERDDDHRLDAGQQLLHVGRVQLPHTLSAVELHRLPRAHDVGGRRRGRERHGPPTPVLGAQARGNLQRPHVVARSDPDGAQRRIEGLEQERDARFRDLGRKSPPPRGS